MNKEGKLPIKAENQELAKITRNQFLTDYAIPSVQKKCRKINEIEQALKLETPSIAKINKQFGEDFLLAYIEGWIVNLREFLNVGKSMTDTQTKETALLIMEQFYNITVAEINLIFKKVKLGHFGQIYDRLDGQVVLSWFDKYYKKRCHIFAEKSINEADKYKVDPHERYSTKIKNKERSVKINTIIASYKK